MEVSKIGVAIGFNTKSWSNDLDDLGVPPFSGNPQMTQMTLTYLNFTGSFIKSGWRSRFPGTVALPLDFSNEKGGSASLGGPLDKDALNRRWMGGFRGPQNIKTLKWRWNIKLIYLTWMGVDGVDASLIVKTRRTCSCANWRRMGGFLSGAMCCWPTCMMVRNQVKPNCSLL